MSPTPRIEVQATEQTPAVLLDKEKGILKIEGFSFPDSPHVFYTNIVSWFSGYCKSPNEETNLTFAFLYVNSTSIKFINDILKKMDSLAAAGKKVSVTWIVNPDDEDIEQLGQELKGLHTVPFRIIPKEPEKPSTPPKKFF